MSVGSTSPGLVGAAAALPEPRMRAALFCERLAALVADDAAAALDDLVAAALGREPHAEAVYAALVPPDVAREVLPRELLEGARGAALEHERPLAALWLRAALETEGGAGQAGGRVHVDFAEMTLGARRAFARRARGDALRKLLGDPDPGVVANLLSNPRITEAAVLALCSRRPTVSAALETVLRHPRFGVRHGMRLALARNPALADALGAALLVLLADVDLVAIREDGTLPPSRRETAALLLGRRRGAPPSALSLG